MPADAPACRSPRPLLALGVLLAFCWQSLVVQLHTHLPSFPAGPGSIATRAMPPADRAPADDPQTCPVCRAAAQAAHYLAPGTIAIAAPPATVVASAHATFLPWPGRHLAHGWRSRGPPGPAAR